MGSVTSSYSNELRTLCNLGLTLQQAKVYLALARIGQASMKELSEAANIDRGECYRIVSQLEDKQLISRVLTSPVKYEVTAFKSTLNILMEKKRKEMFSLQENVEKLSQKINSSEFSYLPSEDEITRYVPIAIARKSVNDFFKSVNKSMDILTDLYRCETFQNEKYRSEVNALRRGIIFRFLISDTQNRFELSRLPHVQKMLSMRGFTLRVISEEIAAPLGIRDQRTANIYISKETHALKSSPIETNNERLVKLAQGYFDSLWNRAREVNLDTEVRAKNM